MPVQPKIRREAFTMERGDGRPIHVVGEEVTIKISSRDTGGAFAVFEAQTRPLHGPPLHLHRDQDEWWYILEGEYWFEVDGQDIFAGAGATVFAPRGSRHTFQNVEARLAGLSRPLCRAASTSSLKSSRRPAPRGTVPNPAKIVPIFEKHGLELLGPPLAARSAMAAAGAD